MIAVSAQGEQPEIIVIGGGQAGLALGYWLQRRKRRFVILDREPGPGGAWRHAWESLTLFSPGHWSSLPGWLHPGGIDTYPSRDAILDYLERYEERYDLPIKRPVRVSGVHRDGDAFLVRTDRGTWRAPVVVSATGTWGNPYVPDYPGRERYAGVQLHSAHYRRPQPFAGLRTLIVGGGNSGAQILAEVSEVTETRWVTLEPPRFLPDDVDGRVLFERATARLKAREEGREVETLPGGFGDIAMVPPVREARERGVLEAVRPFDEMTAHEMIWRDGSAEPVDAVVWCTGFQPALSHLAPLGLHDDSGRIPTQGPRARDCPGLWLLGYGDWTGPASATLIGAGRTARVAANEIDAWLDRRSGDRAAES